MGHKKIISMLPVYYKMIYLEDIVYGSIMKVSLFFLTLAFLNKDVLGCPDIIGWIPAGESCYRTSPEPMNWFKAQQYCAENQGYLAEISSEDETELSKLFLETDTVYWIGLSDNADYGNWIWQHSFHPVQYTNWEKSQPDFLGREHCALTCHGVQWCDYGCDRSTA